MEFKEISKEYTNGNLTVIWKPKLCIHAAECVNSLPKVYNPNEKPWIKAENATPEELMAQIKKCPSGALSYRQKGDEQEKISDSSSTTKVEVVKNGPLLVHGDLNLSSQKGEENLTNKVSAFCRCGASGNKPFCDGSHQKTNFEG